MSRYPRSIRAAKIRCISCNAPAAETVDSAYVCVECGRTVISQRSPPPDRSAVTARSDGIIVTKTIHTAGEPVHVTLSIENTRDTPTRVRVADPLPPEMASTEVTFHSGTDRLDWQRVDGKVEYRGVVPPTASVEGSYLLPPKTADPGPFKTRPGIRSVEPADSTIAGSQAIQTDGEGDPAHHAAAPARHPGTDLAPTGGDQPAARPGDRLGLPPGTPQSIGLLVAIPALNEAATIATVVEGASKHADAVLVVDDGSRDGTADRAEAAGAIVVRHDRHRGYGAALKTAFREADQRMADRLVIIDGDGQHDPGDIPTLVNALDAGNADIVIGSRFVPGAITDLPVYRWLGIRVITVLFNLALGTIRPSQFIHDAQSGFRGYNRDAIDALANDATISDDMDASVDILFHAYARRFLVEEVPTTITYDVENPSSRHPVVHGLSVVRSIVTTGGLSRPLATLGVPGIVGLSTGIGLLTVLPSVGSGQRAIVATVATVLITGGIVVSLAGAVLYGVRRTPIRHILAR